MDDLRTEEQGKRDAIMREDDKDLPWPRGDLEDFEWGDSHDQFDSTITDRVIAWAFILACGLVIVAGVAAY